MISMMSRDEERVIAKFAHLAGGEAGVERALRGFVRRNGRNPDGKELLREIAKNRADGLRAKLAGQKVTAGR